MSRLITHLLNEIDNLNKMLKDSEYDAENYRRERNLSRARLTETEVLNEKNERTVRDLKVITH